MTQKSLTLQRFYSVKIDFKLARESILEKTFDDFGNYKLYRIYKI